MEVKRENVAQTKAEGVAEVKEKSAAKAMQANGTGARIYNYTLHSFITEELGLRHSEANVYALIYSFTEAKGGCYRGSIDGIVRMCRISRATVIRALKSLVEKGLVEKSRKGKSLVYTYMARRKNGIKMTHGEVSSPDTGKVSFCNGESDILRPNNYSYNNSIQKNTPPPRRACASDFDEGEKEGVTRKESLRLAQLDRFTNVILERRQYERLIELYGDEITELYIRRLSIWIEDKSSPHKVASGHYALIRRWIENDLAML